MSRPITVAQWARRLRPRFQVGLLGYIRGERTVQNLEILAKVAEKLEQVATTQPVFQLWWVVGAILEALRANGLEGSATLKRLLGQADRQIKVLYEIGEARYCENPPVDLLNNLLYYVARATTSGGRIAAVRASFKLSELLPVDETVEQERESLSAPSVKLMRTVAAAIKEDLSKVKDVLDIFVRRGGGRNDELIPQLDLLKKISDTLGVLGLGELRQRVQQEVSDLSEMLSGGKTPPEPALVKVAGVLLSIEDSLDDQLVRLILPNTASAAASEASADQDFEFRQVSEAVLRECIVNLARIKEAVSIAVQTPTDFPPQGLDNVPQLLRGITAGLLMLGKGRAVELMDAIGTQVRRLIEPGAPAPDPLRLERVADAIVSIEYYMETLQNGRTDPWYMLDNAEMCIKALAEELPSRVPEVEAAGQDVAQTIKLDPGATQTLERAKRTETAVSPPIAAPAADAVDPQFLELFIEEAKEEIASIQRIFPLWDQNPMDLESLMSLRRSFHTLKGSGRMVGARMIAEFAWSIENLLNRIIDKTLSRTPGMMTLLRSAVAAQPQLVEQLETGRHSVAPLDAIMARAFAYADGREAEQLGAALAPEDRGAAATGILPGAGAAAEPSRPATAAPAPSAPPPAAAAGAAVMDPQLHEIYSKETSSHLAEIRDYLRKRSGQPAPHELPESVYRAIHTLSGSSKMAEARHGIRITEPLNHFMRKVFDSGRGLSDTGLATLAEAVRAIDNVVSHINETTAFFSEQPALLGRLHELETELDIELANAANDTSASAIVPRLPDSAADAGIAAEPSSVSETSVAAEEFDHEIANIYSEEATELIEAAELSLTAWNRDRKDKDRVTELQRQLHTLKGGARMAGITAMGDLSHELESLVIQIDGGAVPGDDRAHAVMQASLDELARMRDLVSAGELPPPASALLAQIRALSSGEVPEAVPPRALAPAPVASPPPAAMSQPATPPMAAPSASRPGPVAVPAATEVPASGGVRGFPRGQQRADTARPRESAGRAGGNGAGRRRPPRHHAQQRGRGEHFPGAARPADQLHRFQPGRARAHGHAAQGTAPRPRNRDRGAGLESASGTRRSAATTSIRSNSTATPRCSSTPGRLPRHRAMWRVSKGCSRH